MNSYVDIKGPNYLPKLKTSSTWYKTFHLDQKSKSLKNLKNNLSDLSNNKIEKKPINIKNLIPRNNSCFLKVKNTSKSKSKIDQKNRPLSVLHSNISSEETDDSIFAFSQIKNIDDYITKRVFKNVVWKEKIGNIYDSETSRNVKDIKNIRKKIHDTRFDPPKNFDLKTEIDKKKYFPVEKVNIINDASDIIKRMENQINEKKKNNFIITRSRVDKQTFIKQNRDICLKNNMINILKNESNKLKIKEKEISKALEDANNILDKDQREFDEYVKNHNKEIKQRELMAEEARKKNKKLYEEAYRLHFEIKRKYDEIEKTIREIKLFYSYGQFIQRIIGNGQTLKKINLHKFNIQRNRNEGKDISLIINDIIKEFDFLFNDNNISDKTRDFNLDTQQMTYLFSSLETVIIKQIIDRDNLIEEKEKIKEKNRSELLFLHNRIDDQVNELNYLNNLKKSNIFLCEPINADVKKALNTAFNYILEIYTELNKIDIGEKNNNDDEDNNLNEESISKETFSLLHKIEDKILFLINEMEKINGTDKEPDELFKTILENVKTENKNKKYKMSKMLLEKIEEEKRKKFQQRNNRIKIRSHVDFPPTWIHKKKKCLTKRRKKGGGAEEGLLFY